MGVTGGVLHISVPPYQVDEVKLIAGDDPSRACEAFLHLVGIQEAVTLTKERASVCSSIEESINHTKASTRTAHAVLTYTCTLLHMFVVVATSVINYCGLILWHFIS